MTQVFMSDGAIDWLWKLRWKYCRILAPACRSGNGDLTCNLLMKESTRLPFSGLGKLIELPGQEDSGMKCHQAKKVRFRFGVAVVLEVLNVRAVGVHGSIA